LHIINDIISNLTLPHLRYKLQLQIAQTWIALT
jgi:hypothetical protein